MYNDLALFYDTLMEAVDYEAWVSYVEEIMDRYRNKTGKVLDLACGTGSSTLPWAKRGYDVVGIDLAPQMLAKARQKAFSQELEVTFLQNDLKNFKLDQKFDLAVCFQDGFNYLLNPCDLQKAFQAVFNNLKSGGLLIFDLNFPNRINSDELPTVAQEEDFTLIWTSRFYEESRLWEIKVTGFLKKENGLYRKFQEQHQERVYEIYEVGPLLAEVGFTLLHTYRSFSFDLPSEKTKRIACIVQKP